MKSKKTHKKNQKKIKFHKLPNQPFKDSKRLNINKTQKEILFSNIYHSPIHRREKRNSIKSSALENLLKTIEDKYSPKESKILKKRVKKMHSSNKINTIKFKNNLTKKLVQKEEEEEKNNKKFLNLQKNIKLEKYKVTPKKYTSSNNINYFKSFTNFNNKYYNISTNFKNPKKTVINNEIEKTIFSNNKSLYKAKTVKNTIQKEKKNKDLNIEKGKLNDTINCLKKKFLCCL
jgi:hypothetical protein